MPRRCCFLSMDSLKGYVSDDELAVGPFAELGWKVDTVSWRKEDIDWAVYEAAIIRTTWDYHLHPREFLEKLTAIETAGVRVLNDPAIVRWNLKKTYLAELESKGAPIVPSVFGRGPVCEQQVEGWLDRLDADELIIKPVVSATSADTYRFSAYSGKIFAAFDDREFIVQPFVRSVLTDGEFSLFYFDGELSHSIVKRPKTGDFRVQEEFGGTPKAVEPSGDLTKAGRKALKAFGLVPLYCRADLVRGKDGTFMLMELELIEPALYLRTDPGAGQRFAAAFDRSMRRNGASPTR